jgi:trimethylamine---corrinoid protein Co-methyltransferase
VIDAEIIGLAMRTVGGVAVREEPIALDIMRQMGHRADYLAHPHTRKWYRQELYIPSAVIDRGSLDAWEIKGSKSTVQRAQDRVEALLPTCPPSPLSDQVRSELRQIATRAASRFGMEQLPPLPQ